MKRSIPGLLAVCLGAASLVVVGLACGGSPTPTGCDAGAVPGEVSLWTECGPLALSSGAVAVVLTNDSADSIWYYHECGDESPWPSRLQDDGTWLRLLPATFFLTTGCQHVMELAAGQSVVLSMSTQRADRPGTYRAETLIARGCMDLHEPMHVPHSCERQDFTLSAPFELR